MEFIVLIMVMIVLAGGGATIYLPAKDEWNKTFARAAMITRANLGSKKDKLELEMLDTMPLSGDKEALEIWQAQYEGRKSTELVIANKNAHVIVKSWNELNDDRHEGIQERWFWECSCGIKEWRKLPESSKNAARRHLKLYGGRNDAGVKDQGWLRGVR
jgi:hypothetical protein